MSSFFLLSGALAKNGSFGYAKGGFACRAKPNVSFMRGLILSARLSSAVRSNRLAPNSRICCQNKYAHNIETRSEHIILVGITQQASVIIAGVALPPPVTALFVIN
jgi:hypothetical protein